MALGHAQAVSSTVRLPVAVVDQQGRPTWSDLWRDSCVLHPDAAALQTHYAAVRNAPGCRPYIREWSQWRGRPCAIFSDWRAADYRARFHLNHDEQQREIELRDSWGPYVVLEHKFKGTSSPNKHWPAERWEAVARLLVAAGIAVVQVGPAGSGVLRAASHFVATPSFLDVMPVLAGALGYVGPEGGLHHAAAALGRPAAVLVGHFAPEVTLYPDHVRFGSAAGCGRWAPCPDCQAELEAITPEQVASGALQHIAAGVL